MPEAQIKQCPLTPPPLQWKLHIILEEILKKNQTNHDNKKCTFTGILAKETQEVQAPFLLYVFYLLLFTFHRIWCDGGLHSV